MLASNAAQATDASNSAGFGSLSVIIPAFNESDGIVATVATLRKTVPGAEIIVVDDGSTDGTLQAALGFDDIVVLHHIFNRGYGASLKSGMEIASRDFIAWFDADNEHRAEDLVAMFHRISQTPLAAVIGQRRGASTTGMRSIGKFAIRALARLFNIDGGHDLNCGLRIFRRDLILGFIDLLPDRYSASLTTTLLFIDRGYPIEFHPISTAKRIGASKVVLRDGFAAMTKVLELVMLTAPMRIFFRLGTILFVVGLVYSLVRSFTEREGFPTAGTLTIILGGLLCLLGLIADQISQLRLSQIRVRGVAQLVQSAPPGQSRTGYFVKSPDVNEGASTPSG
jgi:glycosyltransferase involved in cell wall biosynthesis